jgi:hypothetical protein
MRVGLGIAVGFYRWSAAPFRAYLLDDESGSGRRRQQATLAKLKYSSYRNRRDRVSIFPFFIFPPLMSLRAVFALYRRCRKYAC